MSIAWFWIAGVLIVLAAACAAALAWRVRRRPARLRPPPRATAPARPAAAPVTVPPPPLEPIPMALSTFHWRRPNELPSGHLRVLLAALRGVPRPPTPLQRLLSPDYVAQVSPAQFSAAVMQDPLVAARVLAVVNSPFYGLQKPVDSIEPAVHLLGMETVRGVCMRYMLAQAFKPSLAGAQAHFDALWHASAIASELCLRLAKGLQLPQQGALVTHVVLAFVGHLVAASRLPQEMLPRWLELDPLQRARLEQETMGLTATEVGGLLMRFWRLPTPLVREVCAMGRVLVTPVSDVEPEQVPPLALGYLCVRLGEQLALGRRTSFDGYDPAFDITPDTYHLRTYLMHPGIAPVRELLHTEAMQAWVRTRQGSGSLPQ